MHSVHRCYPENKIGNVTKICEINLLYLMDAFDCKMQWKTIPIKTHSCFILVFLGLRLYDVAGCQRFHTSYLQNSKHNFVKF